MCTWLTSHTSGQPMAAVDSQALTLSKFSSNMVSACALRNICAAEYWYHKFDASTIVTHPVWHQCSVGMWWEAIPLGL